MRLVSWLQIPVVCLFFLLLVACGGSSSSSGPLDADGSGSSNNEVVEGEEEGKDEEPDEHDALVVTPQAYAFDATLEDGSTTPASILGGASDTLDNLLSLQEEFLAKYPEGNEARDYFYDKKIFKNAPFDGFNVFAKQSTCLVALYQAELEIYDVLAGWTQAEQAEGYVRAVETGVLDVFARYTEQVLAAVLRPFEETSQNDNQCLAFDGDRIDPTFISMSPELSSNQFQEIAAKIINRTHSEIRHPLYLGEKTDFDADDVMQSFTELSQAFRHVADVVGDENADTVEDGEKAENMFALLKHVDQKRPRQLVADVGSSLYRVADMIDFSTSVYHNIDDHVANNIHDLMLRVVNNMALVGWVNRRADTDYVGNRIENIYHMVDGLNADPDREWQPISSLYNPDGRLDAAAVDREFANIEEAFARYIEALPEILAGAWHWWLSGVLLLFMLIRRSLK